MWLMTWVIITVGSSATGRSRTTVTSGSANDSDDDENDYDSIIDGFEERNNSNNSNQEHDNPLIRRQ